MPGILLLNLSVALPELFLAAAGLGVLLLGVFLGERSSFRTVTWTTFGALAITFVIVVWWGYSDSVIAFGGLFRADAFGIFMKALVLIGSMTALVLSQIGRAHV